MNVLTVENLEKSFKRDLFVKEVKVLNGVTFSLPPASVTAFLGGNGAGKTTTIKCILGLLRNFTGRVSFFGNEDLTKETLARIGFLPERPYFYDYLTGNEFLEFYGQLSGKYTLREIRVRAKKLLERVGLEAAADKRLRSYSKGMLQKIGIAQAIIHDPELVILDEPMSGLDPDGRLAVAEIIQSVKASGASVFFSSHLINDAEKLCDRVVMFKGGKTVYESDLESLFKQTQKGFSLRTSENEMVLKTDAELQTAIGDALKLGQQILEVQPVRMSLEEIFVSKVLRGPTP